jgi:hypothetical protein
MYTIIEDSSPYFIRFQAPCQEQVVAVCKEIINRTEYTREFTNHKLDSADANKLINIIPLFDALGLDKDRVTLFVSQPGIYRPPHKDSKDMLMGINYSIEINDSECITSWYTDEELKDCEYFSGLKPNQQRPLYLRELVNYIPGSHQPICQMTAKPGEMMLFNVGKFHDWDNRASKNRRIILTLRPKMGKSLTFEQARKIITTL